MLSKISLFLLIVSAVLAIPQVADDASTNEDVCSQPAIKPGPGFHCTAFIPKWTFNSQKGICERFVYGGCKGTKNLFGTLQACLERCGPGSNRQRRSADPCLLPKDNGQCQAYVHRLFFDQKTKSCQLFLYGGCGGNENNFKSLDDCKKTCSIHMQG